MDGGVIKDGKNGGDNMPSEIHEIKKYEGDAEHDYDIQYAVVIKDHLGNKIAELVSVEGDYPIYLESCGGIFDIEPAHLVWLLEKHGELD